MGIKQKTIKTIKVLANKDSSGTRIEQFKNKYRFGMTNELRELALRKALYSRSEKIKIVRNIFIVWFWL